MATATINAAPSSPVAEAHPQPVISQRETTSIDVPLILEGFLIAGPYTSQVGGGTDREIGVA